MNKLRVGARVQISADYNWGGGKYAGSTVRITKIYDFRCDDDPSDRCLIYAAESLDSRDGMILARDIPLYPSDIAFERCDHSDGFDCRNPATQRITTLVEDADVAGHLHFASYCDTHATAISDELAHGEPPNAELVCIIPLGGGMNDASS